jgi:hypothetical protein
VVRLRLRGAIALVLSTALAVAGCGSDVSGQATASSAQEASQSVTSPAASSAPQTDELVGRWERVNKCPELVKALSDAGLAALAPAVAMDYFPDSTPQELARKTDVCEGAEPFVHSHFFSESGAFGSLTEDLEQVDDGTYEILDNTSFRIGNADTGAVFRYEIDGDELSLAPVVTGEMRKEALARPLSFTPAGWSIAVSYPGHAWRRVECAGWC